ncbi:uncharacterized protein [Diabrotica undecimpunctata]|uniref:uncharacterized protein n=1 Tax=Diabrotica undecimpunctata TaxID=50387 RepID=UPI003B63810E
MECEKKSTLYPNINILKKRQRFSDHDDLTLLREVLGHNPFVDQTGWNVIQENLFSVTGKQFSIRTLKDHLERLIKSWLQEYKILRDKSGIEVTETEKDLLCHNIFDLMEESKASKIKKFKPQNLEKQKGVEARNKWTLLQSPNSYKQEDCILDAIDHDYGNITKSIEETIVSDVETEEINLECITMEENTYTADTLQQNETPKKKDMKELPGPSQISKIAGPIRSRKRKINSQKQGLEYLHQYDEKQFELKKNELDIERQKLLLEERKCKLAEFEVQKKLELEEKKLNYEIENRKSLTQIIERQEKLINILINKLSS